MLPNEIPKYGKRLVPSLIDQLAQDKPDSPWISVPVSSELSDGFRDINYYVFANAVNRAAHWIESNIGKSLRFETLPYIGPNDARYFILFAAAVKAGYKIFYLSPKNSLSNYLALLEATDSRVLLHATSTNVQEILDHRSLHDLCVPELEDLLAVNPVPAIPYEIQFEEAKDYPCLVLHTSGTTGHPKPIILTHDSLATMDALWLVPPLDGRECFLRTMAANRRIYLGMPFFHMAGFSMAMTLSLSSSSVVVLGPSDRPISVPLVEQVLENANVTSAIIPPSILEEMSTSEVALDRLSSLSSVFFGGATLSKKAGNAISQRTRLFNQIGSTESVVLITHATDPEDFQYFCFDTARNGITFRETAEAGLYEQVIVRNNDIAVHQGAFKIFPDLQEYATKDLYSKHPTKPNHWLFQGRADDVIVFANGEKWNPCGAEAHIRKHPLISMALISGRNRLQPAVVIELKDPVPGSDFQHARIIDSIWPSIVEANSDSPAHGQIAKSHVMIGNAEKPFKKTAKGTMNRSATSELYAMELDELYDVADSGDVSCKLDAIDLTDKEILRDFLQNVFRSATGLEDLADDADIFNAGANSLQVILAVQKLKSRLSPRDIQLETLTPSMVYSNPSIDKLVSFLSDLVRARHNQTPPQEAPNDLDLRMMVDNFRDYLPQAIITSLYPPMNRHVVVLTGSTGSLGSYLLETLMRQDDVSKIYCLNRKADALERQIESSKAKGLSIDLSRKDVQFLQADLSMPFLGLKQDTYEEMTSNVTSILHNQWQVDFNLSLSSFEPHIRGVCNLVDFSKQTRRNASIFFVSSIGTVQNWERRDVKVPEAHLPDLGLAVGGYGQSKTIASLILEEANRRSGISGAVIRVGQLAGPVRSSQGAWNKWEWFPTLIATSKFLQCLPGDLATMDTIDWIPVDLAADILVELTLASNRQVDPSLADKTMDMFHVVNPKTCQWKDLIPTVQLQLGGQLSVVPMEEWVERLQTSIAAQKTDASTNPGMKLIDFFRSLVADKKIANKQVFLETAETERRSKSLRELEPVRPDWMKGWMKQWGY